MSKENEKFMYNCLLLKELMEETLSPAMSAYGLLVDGKHDKESAYQLSLGFLTIANQSYLAAKILCNEKELDSIEIDPFFEAFKNFKFELKEYIADKDDNSSWLSSRCDQFINGCNGAIDFISNHLKTRNEL